MCIILRTSLHSIAGKSTCMDVLASALNTLATLNPEDGTYSKVTVPKAYPALAIILTP